VNLHSAAANGERICTEYGKLFVKHCFYGFHGGQDPYQCHNTQGYNGNGNNGSYHIRPDGLYGHLKILSNQRAYTYFVKIQIHAKKAFIFKFKYILIEIKIFSLSVIWVDTTICTPNGYYSMVF
jgi:hypothetical protein